MRKGPQGERWRRLDNTAKLFPVIANEHLSNVYRLSVTINEEVVPGTLQRALEEILPQFDSFSVRLRRGFFWYYFESNKRMPVIEREESYPCKYIHPRTSPYYLFRVSYYGNRINLEVFHAITDGMGAVNFLKALVYRYLDFIQDGRTGQAACQKISSDVSMNVEDSYVRNYRRVPRRKYSTRKAFHLKGEYLPLDEEGVCHGYLDLAKMKRVSRSYGVSITKFLAAVLIWTIYQEYEEAGRKGRSIGISLPVNLRAFFGSDTMANFFAVILLEFLERGETPDFEWIVHTVSSQMDEKITKEKLEQTISYNVSNEKKWFLRIAPLFLKWMAMNVIFRRNDRAYTMTLSNIKPIEVEPEYENRIAHFQMMIGVSKRQPVKCAVCAYKDQVTVTFTSVFRDRRLSDGFFGFLKEQGIPVEIESNGVPDKRDDKGAFPRSQYDPKRRREAAKVFYAVLFAVAAILGAVNYVTYSGSLWSVIAIGCIAYVAVTVKYSIMRHANLAWKIVVQTIVAGVLLVIFDHATGYGGWSVNYGIPSILLFADLAVVFLILVNRLNWQSYFMYQIAITIFSFIPILLWAAALVTQPDLAFITAGVTLLILAITIRWGDRSVKTELKRRFHL